MIALGATEISKVCLGENELSKVCLGSNEIWSAGQPLPYDAEVEYLEADGTQWINTGITYRNEIRITCEAQYTGDYNKTQILFGPAATAGLWCGNVNNKGWGIRGSAKGDSSIQTKVSLEYNSSTRKLYLNDMLEDTLNNGSTSTNPIAIFNSYNGNYFSKAIIWSIQIVDNNNQLLFDGIPVRVGQVGFLYDRIGRELHGNEGTGSFTLGPDKINA